MRELSSLSQRLGIRCHLVPFRLHFTCRYIFDAIPWLTLSCILSFSVSILLQNCLHSLHRRQQTTVKFMTISLCQYAFLFFKNIRLTQKIRYESYWRDGVQKSPRDCSHVVCGCAVRACMRACVRAHVCVCMCVWCSCVVCVRVCTWVGVWCPCHLVCMCIMVLFE